MVEIPQNILEITNEYINKVRAQIPVEKAILFGSYSKGTYMADSDVDIAIFSSAFEEMTRIDGLTFLLMQALGYKLDLQPQPFTMKEYEEKTGLVSEIIRTGVELL